MMEELFHKSDRKLDELINEMRATKQRLAGLGQDARQPCLAMEEDVPSNTKTEGAAAAVQAMHRDSYSANRIDPDLKRSTSFGDDFTRPPPLPCSRNDALVGNGAAAPKSCISSFEMRTPTAAGDLLPPGKTSTATVTILHQLPLCSTEEISLRTSIQYASYYSTF